MEAFLCCLRLKASLTGSKAHLELVQFHAWGNIMKHCERHIDQEYPKKSAVEYLSQYA